ncbi:MAG: RHS repeat-associated core domain-containing protein [Flavobacterium sp. JAD_PAG50586_2]|nr:MAG: RHS repeat-associated core domain-containing protein [Flavobacterium sp. JAD_PAG50586_2]
MYNESMGYDKNGNIKKLKRWGDFDSDIYAAIKIDELHYYYENDNKNRLMKVTDASNSPKGFYDDTITDPADASDDYGYDDYGNMTSDENKKIMNIVYNHLNLPVEINFGAGNKIEYLYDASGRKLWKKATENTSEIDVDYLDGFQYMNGVLDFFPHAEGYVKVLTCPECEIKRTFNYVYQYKDHLGNIRMSYGVDPEEEEVTLKILEENHYYPFGLKHTKYNSNEKMYELVDFRPTIKDILAAGGSTYKYKYNGKEYQDELGLNVYDYGAMMYDPALGRRNNIDPKAEESRRWSPYSYCYNNPMRFVDPDGMKAMPSDWINADGKRIYDTNKNNGKGGYTKYATAEDKEFGENLRTSGKTGEEQFNYLVSSNTQDIQIQFLPTDSTDGGGNLGYSFGQTTNSNDVKVNADGTVSGNSKIEIYKGTASTYSNDVKNNSLKTDLSETNLQKGDNEILKNSNLSAKDVITATIGHELIHTTPNNISVRKAINSGDNNANDELRPQKVYTQILKDLATKK